MTYTATTPQIRYQSYQEYLDDEQLSSERNYRLLSTGELIEVASEDDMNLMIATGLLGLLLQLNGGTLKKRVRAGNKEMQVPPIGDQCVNRKPDVIVLHPDHLIEARQAIKVGMLPPLFVAEVVSPGPENSDNYQRDYVWKRQQYQWWQIPEYWIIDPHRQKVTVLVLVEGKYQETVYANDGQISAAIFPELKVIVHSLLTGDL